MYNAFDLFQFTFTVDSAYRDQPQVAAMTDSYPAVLL